jgi:hypothetical protein
LKFTTAKHRLTNGYSRLFLIEKLLALRNEKADISSVSLIGTITSNGRRFQNATAASSPTSLRPPIVSASLPRFASETRRTYRPAGRHFPSKVFYRCYQEDGPCA